MKNVLITGANSYIGTNLEDWLARFPGQYKVSTLDLKNDSWKEHDFTIYDSIFHVAGIAHIKETEENKDLYFKVNKDLTVNVAKKAKESGIKQFVFLSSMSVYGVKEGVISKSTIPAPNTSYGVSKLVAERELEKLSDNSFKVSVLRPPMVYGKGCKGNYQTLRKLALTLPLFPRVKNKRSMIYIGNLCEFVRTLIDNESDGIFCPQNKEYVNTSNMVKSIAQLNNKKIYYSRLLVPLVSLARLVNIVPAQKAFGNLIYEKDDLVDTFSFEESMIRTEQ